MANVNNKNNEVPEYNGLKGIRATLNNYGYNNDEIGFDENKVTVTIGGKDFMKPTVYDSDNGITYASEQDIRQSLKNFDDPIREVTPYYSAYAGKNNLPLNAVNYSDGSVTIGGKSIPYAYIDENNKAWARQSDLDHSFEDYKSYSGIQSGADIWDKYDSLYGTEIKNLINQIKDREDFSYDAESDPVYAAYKKMYEREGNRSAEDTMAAYSAQTGGYANSAAVTAAANARQYYSEKLTDIIPELEARAYDRYIQSYENDIASLDAIKDLYLDMFNMEYKVSRDTADDLYRATADDIERDRYSEENSRKIRADNLDYLLGVQKLNSNYMFDEQNYRLGEQEYQLGEQNYRLGEQKLKLQEQSYRQGEMDLLTDSIKQEILEQDKKLNEQKIHKNEQEIRMNDVKYTIAEYERDLKLYSNTGR